MGLGVEGVGAATLQVGSALVLGVRDCTQNVSNIYYDGRGWCECGFGSNGEVAGIREVGADILT